MKRRIVIALGGNALGDTLPEQMAAVKITSRAIADLLEEHCEVIIAHGNGPQVGMIYNAMKAHNGEMPLSVCVAMSQSYIGYDLQNALREELINRGILHIPVSTMITQVLVDPGDPAFSEPTKPIGKGEYRRVVPSPLPLEIIELEAIRSLVDSGQLVIAVGGGGIPVIRQGNHLKGVTAVIDKDLSAELLAENLGADTLIILTAVEKVCLNYGTPDEVQLDQITAKQARDYMEHFGTGSMRPKVLAAVKFAESQPGRRAVITLLQKARDGIHGKTGTVICN